MTTIRYREKPVWHETGATVQGAPVLAAEQPESLLLRLKGTRQTLALPWANAYLRAAQLQADANVSRKRHTVRRGVLI